MILLFLVLLVMLFLLSPLSEMIALMGLTILTVIINTSPLFFPDFRDFLSDKKVTSILKPSAIPSIVDQISKDRFLSISLSAIEGFSLVRLNDGDQTEGVLGSSKYNKLSLDEFRARAQNDKAFPILMVNLEQMQNQTGSTKIISSPGPIIVYGKNGASEAKGSLKFQSASFVIFCDEDTFGSHIEIDAPVVVLPNSNLRSLVSETSRSNVLYFSELVDFARTTTLDLLSGKTSVQDVRGLVEKRFMLVSPCEDILVKRNPFLSRLQRFFSSSRTPH